MKDRTLKILRILITSDYPVTLEKFEEEFHTSSRTIRNELREINQFLLEKDFPEIKNLRKKGYQLLLTSEQKKALMNQNELVDEEYFLDRENRIFDLILSFSLGKKATFLYQKEEAYQISKSTLDEDMRRVRNILSDYGLEVLSVPKQGIVLQGAERSIRTMIYDVINNSVGMVNPEGENEPSLNLAILNFYLPLKLLKKLDQLYVQSMTSMEGIYRNQLLIFTAVWLSRYLREDIIASSAWEAADTPQSDIRDFVTAICEHFQITPPEVEIKYIVFMLNTFNSRDMNNSIEWVQAQLLSIQLMQFIETETKIPFSRKEESLQEGLYKHIVGLLNRVKSNIQIVNPLKETVKKNYGDIYVAIKRFAPTIEALIGNELSEDEIAFLTIHFSTSVSAINQDLHYVYKAVVICNHGIATGKLLSENLKELFNIEVLAVLSSKELQVIEKLDVDLVFSTVAVDYQEKPVIELEPIIKEESKRRIESFLTKNQDLKCLINNSSDSTQMFYSLIEIIEKSEGKVNGTIYKELEALFDKNHLTMNKKEIQPMLEDVLTSNNILLNEEVETWEESIVRVSEPLLKNQVIEPSYVSAMIDSVKEFGPYIVIGKHLALAHARPEDGVNKLGISVATTKKPIAFGNEENDPVKIIFCLAAVDSYSHLNIMKSLIELINDADKIERLSQETDVERFQEILFS
ncbi:PTS sugar transporter subunit IIA [Enterococcus devriesei]|uniref:BglG family transcription antiterminator n=1 Tax=Enterococcus devriesei TaxID=319970 RepID=UPI0028B1F808|nr:PTS sugar transporter subunit IIA [Enterococcus devriesei]